MNDEEDAALFRVTVGKVTPLAEQNRIALPPPPVQTRVRSTASPHTLADTLSDFLCEAAPADFLRNGLSRLTLRKLRRSAIQDSLDLHGHSGDAARQLLQEFLHQAAQNQLRCVRVIHGKGMNSPGGEAVLRTLARNWLAQHPQVLAYCAASPAAGGDGAVLILLKSGAA
jgi:DNA-nicking Smr family endonuclease